MDKKKGHPEGQPISLIARIDDTSCTAQRNRLIKALHDGPISTFQAVQDLNIMRPGARINELRKTGHLIDTQLARLEDAFGRTHSRVAIYSLRIPSSRVPLSAT